MLVKRNPKSPTPDTVGIRWIKLTNGFFAIVDDDDFLTISKYYWIAAKSGKKFYAARRIIRNGKSQYVFMHRQIMNTPDGQIVHHENSNTLDNRKANLTNMAVDEHKYIHGFR